MVKQTIQIFARIKPTKSKAGLYEIDDEDGESVINFVIPREISAGLVNNTKETYKFKFQKLFDQPTKQDEIFEVVSKPVIDNVLRGYNGTIFAYGQTGSGKTFTITGGAERYIDRGIIPRTLTYIYDYYEKNSEFVYSTHISYLEIYNENGYDLLDPKHEAAKLEDLPKVALMEDTDQNIHLRNLSTHQANNEEEALNLLFLGDTNRMIAETPMNQASTRSHCIFTIHITSRESGSATQRRSKLHLVDLAGSERVSKTGVNGVLLKEAKYINLSLHFLEQVIVCLAEKGRTHIPYRNSMMTSVLRDSLGGNCMTTMIATCAVDKRNIEETLSTCRFAQRVALIKNDAILNEELDPKLMIIKMKREIQQLKDELSMATGQQRTDQLSEEELDRCKEAVKIYIGDTDPETVLDVGADMRKIQECYRLLKELLIKRSASGEETGRSLVEESSRPDSRSSPVNYNTTEIRKLQGLLQQRDNEINILVNMLKKEKKRASEALSSLERLGHSTRPSSVVSEGRGKKPDSSNGRISNEHPTEKQQRKASLEKEDKTKSKILGEMSMGRQEAFEIFRRDYENNKAIEENKNLLKQRYALAKQLGEAVNQSRGKMNKLKSQIEQYRMSCVMQGLIDPDNPVVDDTESEMKSQIELEKSKYKELFNRLRNSKSEIEHLQHLLEKSKVKLLKDFELWWAEQAALSQEQSQLLQFPPPDHAGSAWKSSAHKRPTFQLTPLSSSQSSLVSSSSSAFGSRELQPSNQKEKFSNGNESLRKTKSASEPEHPLIPLTGDAEADADIMAFLKARQTVIKHAKQQVR